MADLPPGTASNYFRSREALLVAAAERIAELHHADTDRAMERPATLADLLTESLLTAATTLRDRYRAIFELQLEAARRPALASTLASLQDTALLVTAGHHDQLGLTIPRERIPAMIALYGGALFTLVSAPPGTIDREAVRNVAQVIVYGCTEKKGQSGAKIIEGADK
ncbi:TetR/AcrR family transcriptional regulator [Nonomuraea sp. NPDC050451]|uniref:TetR/AcrR family transcriptional regulator n=1 Tax=Nonomuraea sp. NPDC050451 TaxID=3364364 RepID=UPI003795378B